MSAERVEAWLAANRQRLLDELFELLRAPSVSTDPAYAAGLARAAEILAERLRRIGMRDVQMLDGGGNPAVFAQWCGAPGAPTTVVGGSPMLTAGSQLHCAYGGVISVVVPGSTTTQAS
ncbi:MAG: hypothetical protein J0H91_22620 [Rhodospirillales bacterium]|nr:hypothetical protein [Rhodospirillales bacterium]